MIERYSITASLQQVSDRFSVDVPEFYKPRYNAAPTQLLPVITSASPNGVSLFYWGTSPEWSNNKVLSEKIINLRVESFSEKPTLKKSLQKNRCIIPADSFYGWKKVGKKTSIPYRFVMKNRELFSFAALWEEFEDTDGNEIQTFKILTTASNTIVSMVQDRMPIILTKEQEALWLDHACKEDRLISLMGEDFKATIDYYPVSPKISDSSADVPSLIIPTPPADQHGNLTLFD